MEELLVRLSAVDPEAAGAVRVIAYFDALVEGRAGIEPFVRAAAVLSGCTAGLHDPDRHVFVRIDPDGRRRSEHPDGDWPRHAVNNSAGQVWLERHERGPMDAIILERLAAGTQIVLDRTRGRAPAHDPASVEALLNAEAAEEARRGAARRLTLPDGRIRVVAIVPPIAGTRWSTQIGNVVAAVAPANANWDKVPNRLGIGPAVELLDAPTSWEGALAALRLTADSPGVRHLRYDDLGGLVALRFKDIADVDGIRVAVTAVPDALLTLNALVGHDSLRQAAAALHIHHSTLQDRVKHFQKFLGYSVDTVPGRCRLYVALAMYRLGCNAGLVE